MAGGGTIGARGLARAAATAVAKRTAAGLTSALARRGVEVVPGQDAGWSRGGWTHRLPGSKTNKVTSPLNVYGGTDESVSWVYDCVTLRAQSMGAYDWWAHRKDEPKKAIPRPGRGEVGKFYTLMDEPNEEMTYFDMVEEIVTDLDLCGNSFWLADQQNPLGQPLALQRFWPGTIKIVKNDAGKKVGYVYEPINGGPRVPYELTEIIHFRYPNPLNRYYGMGIVEALIRAVNGDISQQAHVTAFFDQGAHFSGVLTVPETVGEEEFKRMKQQYQDEFSNSDNSFRVLIAEQAQSYTPISQGPSALGVVDLRHLSKDEILSGFGVPEFLLGGTGQGGVYKMEEAQNIFYRAMIPTARRISSRFSMDVAGRYSLSSANAGERKPIRMRINPQQSDTQTTKVARARQLVGTGATIDMILEEAGQEPLGWAGVTDLPALPSGLVLIDRDGNAVVAHGTQPPPDPQSHGQNGDQGGEGGSGGDGASPESGTASGNDSEDTSKRLPTLAELVALPPVPEVDETALPRFDDILGELGVVAPVPMLEAEPQRAPQALAAADELADLLREHFIVQRHRALDALSQYGSTGARLKSKPTKRKADLTAAALWDAEAERVEVERVLRDAGFSEGVSEAAEEVCERVYDGLADVVGVGMTRGYSVAQIANGFQMERYGGVVGLFDALAAGAKQVADATRNYLSANGQ